MDDVRGHLIELSGGRKVFVGQSPTAPNRRFVAMVNGEGEETKFSISEEGARALRDILLKPGGDCEPPITKVWRWVAVAERRITDSSVSMSFNLISFRFKMMSVTSSRIPGAVVNSCATPSISTEEMAAPWREDSRIRLSEFPIATPNPP